MWDWMRRRAGVPTTRRVTVGRLDVPSGAVLIADPSYLSDDARIDGVPPGRHRVWADIVRYPEGGRRVARAGLTFRPGTPDRRAAVSDIPVDTATVVVADAGALDRHWQEVGPERIGHIDHRGGDIGRLIEARFGLTSRPVNPRVSEIVGPVSEALEADITAFLESLPEYAKFTFMHFTVQTMNTADRVADAMTGRLWADVDLDRASRASLLAFKSGFGDGSYPVERLVRAGELVGVEVTFIGPDQDRVLEAFPLLRQ